MEFEPANTGLGSDALTDWPIRPWVQLVPRNKFLHLFQFHRLFSVKFHFGFLNSTVAKFILIDVFLGNHMSIAEWATTYRIHHWHILRSSYRKVAWIGFETRTTEFRSAALTNWSIRPWVKLPLRANFVQLLQFHGLFSVIFHFGCLSSSVTTFILMEVFCT